MKCVPTLAMVLTFICFLFTSLPVSAANKSIYIKPFGIGEGLAETDTVGERIQNYISEEILAIGGYNLTSDDEVKQVIKQEELKMSIDCYDDACIKKLMESIRTDYIIYGTIVYEDGNFHIVAKMLDRSDGTVKLARVKSLMFKEKNKIRMACTDLAKYLIDGDEIDMDPYNEASYVPATTFPKKVPSGLAISFVYFTPNEEPFKDLYDALIGGGIDYYYSFNNYLAVTGGLYYVQGNDPTGDVTVSLNSYSIGARAGFPIFGFMYPYVGIAGRLTWFNERTTQENVSFTGYGGDGSAGCAFIIGRNFTVWADYSMSMVTLNDEDKSDISGSVIRGGLMYAF